MVNYCCNEEVACRKIVWCTKIAILKIVRRFLCKVIYKCKTSIRNPVPTRSGGGCNRINYGVRAGIVRWMT
jgi:hypothetical protein